MTNCYVLRRHITGLALCWMLVASSAVAQQTASITGTVRDTTDAPLPGVTVEASSPALIEKLRSVVTDSAGQYRIVDLQPGTYTLVFSLTGFRSLKRDGVQLASGFAATVNADLAVGGVEETITVTGASSLVDTQNVRQQTRVTNTLLAELPSPGGMQSVMNLVAGAPGISDVGGSAGFAGSNLTASNGANPAVGRLLSNYRGKTGTRTMYDGFPWDRGVNQQIAISANPQLAEEVVFQSSGAAPEFNAASWIINIVPREGGNAWKFDANAKAVNDKFLSNNLSDEARARGLTSVDRPTLVFDVSSYVSGPILKDRLWFFGGYRGWGVDTSMGGVYYNLTQGSPVYTPDLSREATRSDRSHSFASRLTWQASQRNKFSFLIDYRPDDYNIYPWPLRAAEALPNYAFQKDYMVLGTWKAPVTNRLLVEAGASMMRAGFCSCPANGGEIGAIPITEQSTGFTYNTSADMSTTYNPRYSQRAALTYVTGSHAFKAGIQVDEAKNENENFEQSDVTHTFNNGLPVSLTQRSPAFTRSRMAYDLGLYAQDQWTLNRLTLNYGLRLDNQNGYVPPQETPATRFLGARSYDKVPNTPKWRDLNPRVGMAYDLFGDARTAVKATLNRYVETGGTSLADANNPIVTSINTVSRTWNDINRNFAPDCDLVNPLANGECLQISNLNFGNPNPSTFYSSDWLEGFGKRGYIWETSVEMQQQLGSSMSLSGGWFHNWRGNFRVRDNTLVGPADFDSFCVQAPLDARLPGGRGL